VQQTQTNTLSLALQTLAFCLALATAAPGWVEAQQPVRLPPVVRPESLLNGDPNAAGTVPMYSTGPDKVLPATYPSELNEPLIPDNPPSATPPPPPGAKPGMFQQLAVSTTTLPAGNSGFGITDWTVQATFALPAPTPDSPLVLTPAFEAYYLDGPETSPPDNAELPPRLYDASFTIRWLRKVNECWGIDIGVTPGWHGDFERDDPEAFRLPARAIAAYDWRSDTQLVIGVVYLDRDDINWLPAAGIIWKPSDDIRYDLIFPRPKLAHRFACNGNEEDWWYVSAEFGGGSYAFVRTDGSSDVATLSDYRLIFGYEHKVIGGVNTRFEAGYVFGREIQYQSDAPTYDPDPTFLARIGATY